MDIYEFMEIFHMRIESMAVVCVYLVCQRYDAPCHILLPVTVSQIYLVTYYNYSKQANDKKDRKSTLKL